MKKRLKATPVLAVIALALMISPLKVKAAPSIKEYTVTYRPGNIAKFSEALVETYEERYGEDKVAVSQATGSISITIPAGSYYPEAPKASDIVFDEAHQGRYYMTTGWIPTKERVVQDDDYVVDYAALIDAVQYTVRYVDAETGMDLVSPTMTQANAGDTVVYAAKVIEHYAWDAYIKQMVLDKEKDNVITFYYSYVKNPEYETIYLQGETIYNVITLPGRELPGEGTQGSNQGQGGENQGNENQGDENQGSENQGNETQGGETQGENQGGETQGENQGNENQGNENQGNENQGGSEGNQNGTGEVIIDEEPIPLAQFLKENGTKVGLLAGGIAALGALLATTVYQIKKNKKTEEE